MTVGDDGVAGKAIIVPCRTIQSDAAALFTEAEALWKAEYPSALIGSISSSWGCVGVRFHDEPPPIDLKIAWTEGFRAKNASPISPVNCDGLISIPWPEPIDSDAIDVDVVLATVSRAEDVRPKPEDIADAWIDQNRGHERYFFENVRHDIRTADDSRIWQRIESRNPTWLLENAYAEVIRTLRAESS
jgi:hypothetical protein